MVGNCVLGRFTQLISFKLNAYANYGSIYSSANEMK